MNRYTPIVSGQPCTMLSESDREEAADSCWARFGDRFQGFEDGKETQQHEMHRRQPPKSPQR